MLNEKVMLMTMFLITSESLKGSFEILDIGLSSKSLEIIFNTFHSVLLFAIFLSSSKNWVTQTQQETTQRVRTEAAVLWNPEGGMATNYRLKLFAVTLKHNIWLAKVVLLRCYLYVNECTRDLLESLITLKPFCTQPPTHISTVYISIMHPSTHTSAPQLERAHGETLTIHRLLFHRLSCHGLQ